jgi:hypothetical protein
MLDHILALADDVLGESLQSLQVVGLDQPVAALHAVAAKHDEVPTHVVAWVSKDVVQRESADGDAAESALGPLEMKASQ